MLLRRGRDDGRELVMRRPKPHPPLALRLSVHPPRRAPLGVGWLLAIVAALALLGGWVAP